jgi:hypothetical protein
MGYRRHQLHRAAHHASERWRFVDCARIFQVATNPRRARVQGTRLSSCAMQYCLHGQVTVSLVGRRRVRWDIFRRKIFILFTVRAHLLHNRYGQPIHVADYAAEFLSGVEGAEKTTVKKLTKEIGSQLVELTVNAPNWFIPS